MSLSRIKSLEKKERKLNPPVVKLEVEIGGIDILHKNIVYSFPGLFSEDFLCEVERLEERKRRIKERKLIILRVESEEEETEEEESILESKKEEAIEELKEIYSLSSYQVDQLLHDLHPGQDQETIKTIMNKYGITREKAESHYEYTE